MTEHNIFTNRKPFSECAAREHLGAAIVRIKASHRLTWDDLDSAFGKTGMAPKYAEGSSDMPLSVFIRGCAVFGSEFADAALGFAGGRFQSNEADGVHEIDLAALLTSTLNDLLAAMAPASHGGRTVTLKEKHDIASKARPLVAALTALIADADGLQVAA